MTTCYHSNINQSLCIICIELHQSQFEMVKKRVKINGISIGQIVTAGTIIMFNTNNITSKVPCSIFEHLLLLAEILHDNPVLFLSVLESHVELLLHVSLSRITVLLCELLHHHLSSAFVLLLLLKGNCPLVLCLDLLREVSRSVHTVDKVLALLNVGCWVTI